jgi:hypothetical protein
MKNHDEYSNVELVTLVLYQLGGSTSVVDLEDVAVEVHKLAPNRFSWKKYADQIDIKIVQYSLSDACKKKYGYAKGGSKFGYMLTTTGVEWAEKADGYIDKSLKSRKFSSTDLVEKEKTRLLKSQAYVKFISNETSNINSVDFREFTRVNDFFPKHVKQEKYSKIENVVKDDDGLKKVWGFLKSKFLEE